MDISDFNIVHTACMVKIAKPYAKPDYIPGQRPFATPPTTNERSSWFQRLKASFERGRQNVANYIGNEMPTLGKVVGIYPRITGLKYGPDTPQYADAHRDPRAWDMNVKRTNDPNMLLTMGDWGAKNQARLANIARFDPRYEYARLTGAREEDIINHHMLNVEMPRYRAATGNKNMRANVPLTPEQEAKLYEMDSRYKLKSAPMAMTQQQRDAATKYLVARRKAQEELSAGGNTVKAFGAGADIQNPFDKKNAPELYEWLQSASRR